MTRIAEAATRLLSAASTRTPCAPIRDLIGSTDVTAAYAVQQAINAHRSAGGARRVGRKIGLTSPAVQKQIGVSQPDFGVLFDEAGYTSPATVRMSTLLQPKVEAEVAFVLSSDLEGDIDLVKVRKAIAYATPAIEIVDSRVANWDITFGDTVADNASFGAYVLGSKRRDLKDFEPVEVSMITTLNGSTVSTGQGADCLGDPLNAVLWLARKAVELGDPLRKGEIVLSGALGPMAGVKAGDVVETVIEGLGSVSVTFVDE